MKTRKELIAEEREEKRKDTLSKMRIYNLHASEVAILEEAGEI